MINWLPSGMTLIEEFENIPNVNKISFWDLVMKIQQKITKLTHL